MTEALIATAILGLMLYFVTDGVSRLDMFGKNIEKMEALNDLRLHINQSFDCRRTMFAGDQVCSEGEYISGYDTYGALLGSGERGDEKQGFEGAHYALRFRCRRSMGQPAVDIEYAEWEYRDGDWKNLFAGIPKSCCSDFESGNEIIGEDQIRSLLGLEENHFVAPATMHARMICSMIGFADVHEANQAGGGLERGEVEFDQDDECSDNISNKKIGFWRAKNQTFQWIDACSTKNKNDGKYYYLKGVNCAKKRLPGCDKCPSTLKISDHPGGMQLNNIESSYYPDLPWCCPTGSGYHMLHENGSIEPFNINGVKMWANFSSGWQETGLKACELYGYRKLKDIHVTHANSCHDNSVNIYDADTDTFSVVNECGQKSSHRLECEDPGPRCDKWYIP